MKKKHEIFPDASDKARIVISLNLLIKKYGSLRKAAKRIDMSSAQFCRWLKNEGYPSIDLAIHIERKTKGFLTRIDLAPQYFK